MIFSQTTSIQSTDISLKLLFIVLTSPALMSSGPKPSDFFYLSCWNSIDVNLCNHIFENFLTSGYYVGFHFHQHEHHLIKQIPLIIIRQIFAISDNLFPGSLSASFCLLQLKHYGGFTDIFLFQVRNCELYFTVQSKTNADKNLTVP